MHWIFLWADFAVILIESYFAAKLIESYSVVTQAKPTSHDTNHRTKNHRKQCFLIGFASIPQTKCCHINGTLFCGHSSVHKLSPLIDFRFPPVLNLFSDNILFIPIELRTVTKIIESYSVVIQNWTTLQLLLVFSARPHLLNSLWYCILVKSNIEVISIITYFIAILIESDFVVTQGKPTSVFSIGCGSRDTKSDKNKQKTMFVWFVLLS